MVPSITYQYLINMLSSQEVQ